MNKKISILSILVLCLFTCGCSSKSSNELNVLNWSSYIPDEVIEEFEEETGVKVNYGTYSSNEECLAKVSSVKKGTYDLIFPSDYMIELMINRDLIEKIDKSRLDNYSNINSNYLGMSYDKNNTYSIPFIAASTVIAVNTDNIKDNITSYNDLLNPKYKDNIVLIDDQRIIIGMALQSLGYNMNDTSKDHLEEAKEFLLKLKKNVKAFDSDSPKTFLISKEVDIGLIWNAEAAIANKENSNIKVIYPTDGFAVSIDNFAIPKGSKNIGNAYSFIDYILKSDVMKKIIDSYPYKNINSVTDELLDESYLNSNASNIPDEIMKKGSFVENIGSSILAYDRIWAQIK